MKLTDFELAIAEYMWPLNDDIDELMQIEDYRNIAKRDARTILALAKKELLKDAVEGEVVKDISNKLAVTAKINLDGFKFGEKVKILIIKDDETLNP